MPPGKLPGEPLRAWARAAMKPRTRRSAGFPTRSNVKERTVSASPCAFCMRALLRTGKSALQRLRQNPFHHMPSHVRQPEVAALVAIGQPPVINAAEVKHRGV